MEIVVCFALMEIHLAPLSKKRIIVANKLFNNYFLFYRSIIINIEKWCIDNKFGGFTEVTDFTKPKKVVTGPFADHVMCGNFMIPLNQFCSKCGLDTQGNLMINHELIYIEV